MAFEVRALNDKCYCFGVDKTDNRDLAFRIARAYTKKARTTKVLIHDGVRLIYEFARVGETNQWAGIDCQDFADKVRRKTLG